MRATVMFGAGDVRIETVPDARLIEPTDALVVVTRACICGSDLWPYRSMEHSDTGERMGHEFIGVVEAVGGDVRHASMEVGGPGTASTEDRARRCVCRRRTGRSSSCRSAQTTR
jgi:threonine dehydrogenase-like Zn-dependent dehydrogenase